MSRCDTELLVGRIVLLLEKVKVSPSKITINEANAELKVMKDYLAKVNGISDDQYIKNLLMQMSRYITSQSNQMEVRQSKELQRIIFSFFTQVGEMEDVRVLLRDDCTLLIYFTSMLRMELSHSERSSLMTLVEYLSRDISIPWKYPYVTELIQLIVDNMLSNEAENHETDLQILINMCMKNNICVLIFRSCPNYKQVWKMLRTTVLNQNINVTTLVSLLNYLSDISIPSKDFQSGYDLAKSALHEAIKQHDLVEQFNKLTRAARQIIEITCMKMKNVLEDDNIKSLNQGSDEQESFASSKYKLLELVTGFQEELHKFVHENRDQLREETKESILLMVTTCLLPYTTSSCEPSLHRNCTAAAETVRRILTSSSRPTLQLQAYKTILHISELIFQNKSIVNDKDTVNDFVSLFKDVVRTLKVDSDILVLSGITLESYTVNIKLFSLLIFDPQVKESVKQKLSANNLLSLFNKTTVTSADVRLRYRHSVFAIELLNLIRHFVRHDEIANYLSVPGIANHVSNCIRNGDEKDIAKALALISSIGPTSFNLISRSLKQAQEFILSVPNPSPEGLSNTEYVRSKFDYEIMDYADDCPKDSLSSNLDILSWVQLRREFHQQEISALNSHICQLNKTVNNLNMLLEKQSNFITRHCATSEQRDMEISTLQHRYEDSAKKAQSRIAELEQEATVLREEGLAVTEKSKLMIEKIKKLEENIVKITTDCKAAEELNGEYKKQLKETKDEIKASSKKIQQLQQENEHARSRIVKLEDDINLKEREAEEKQIQLDNKQKMIDGIKGILGPAFAGFDMQ